MGVANRPDIETFDETPFVINKQDRLVDDVDYAVFTDKWPVCDGHLLFVPKENNSASIALALKAVVDYGDELRSDGKIDSYHFGMNIGPHAGQTVMWPHIHFIPRHAGDAEGFPGSVRLAHRNGRGASYYMQHPDFKDEYIEIHKDHKDIKGFKDT